jgi:hypothetical protein
MTNGIKKPADRKNCQTGYAEIWQMRRHTECWQMGHTENCQVIHTENWRMEFTDILLELTGMQGILICKMRHDKN